MAGEYVQFGCGTTAPKGFRNFDAGPAFWLQKFSPFLTSLLKNRGFPVYPDNIEYCDVAKGFPLAPGSATAVYCSHVLEHLSLDNFRATLRNTFTILEPGGTFRLVLPDLEHLLRTYMESDDPEAASRFMRESYLGTESHSRGFTKFAKSLFGRSAHLWMWDEKNMKKELAEAGFTAIRRAHFGDNPDPRFREVESSGRWENCLGMECKRPL
jgi:predicted SAM-dependent methyltransferase